MGKMTSFLTENPINFDEIYKFLIFLANYVNFRVKKGFYLNFIKSIDLNLIPKNHVISFWPYKYSCNDDSAFIIRYFNTHKKTHHFTTVRTYVRTYVKIHHTPVISFNVLYTRTYVHTYTNKSLHVTVPVAAAILETVTFRLCTNSTSVCVYI